ncbi:uncharacterized protein Bfra_011491 [Botrytis fragariae]|uniref:2EXR domain-containing protein n=1 Tax=Botrytis fragariae TaxID=1964551 RepID=A0A8H6AY22_9HELO|nr:uncharacterized protein Bfra_011491 [Botrytis fragariae]KAF5875728.1 hypothetical protein Bfra_011491 [Botrytis fragariae]
MCKDCPPLNPWEEGYQDNRDPRDGIFEKFSLLPTEVQCAIFREALPSPQVINLAFKITETRDHGARKIIRQLEVSIPTNPSMLPLLKACAISNAEVYRNVKDIVITRLGTKNPFTISNPVLGIPPHIRDYEVVNRLKASTKPNTRGYTYMRVDKDILMLDAANVFTLYSYGGTILMSNIKYLALQNASLDGMSWELPGSMLGVNYELHRLHIFFKIISLHCPALSKVYFLLDGRNYFHFNESPVQSQKLELRILDMDSDFFIQDFTGMETEYKAEGEWEISARMSLQEDAKYVMRDWKQYRKAIVQNTARDRDVVNFWKTREPIVGLVGWFYADTQDESSVLPLPRMYIPSVLAWLPAHADGTIVDKYKGLAQIFDGAPW